MNVAKKIENKVVIEITAKGWKKTLYLDGKKYSREMRRKTEGSWTGTKKGDFYDDIPDEEELAEAIENCDDFTEICEQIGNIDGWYPQED